MSTILFCIGLFYLLIKILKEVTEKPAPPEQRFDWDKYWEDARNKVDPMEVVRRRKNGYYYTTEPLEKDK